MTIQYNTIANYIITKTEIKQLLYQLNIKATLPRSTKLVTFISLPMTKRHYEIYKLDNKNYRFLVKELKT